MNNLVKHKWKRLTLFKLKNDDTGVYVNPDMVEFIKSVDLKNKTVVDGGSNIGIVSVFLSKRIGKRGTVYAFEIQSTIYEIAIMNAKENGRGNIIHYNKALSNASNQQVGFSLIDYSAESISSAGVKTEWSLAGKLHCGSIETIALDDMNIDNIGLIKLDLEGYEPKALEGMWATIDRCKPHLIIELSPIYLENKQQETIDKILSHGYSVKELTDYNYIFSPI